MLTSTRLCRLPGFAAEPGTKNLQSGDAEVAAGLLSGIMLETVNSVIPTLELRPVDAEVVFWKEAHLAVAGHWTTAAAKSWG